MHARFGSLTPVSLSVALLCSACGDDGSAATDESSEGTTEDASSSEASSGGADSSEAGTDEASSGDESSGDESTGEPLPDPLVWIDDCSFDGSDFSELDPTVECTGIEVPLDWDDEASESIQIAAFRVRTSAADRVGQIWLLDGGPGGSGVGFLGSPLVTTLREAGFDVMIPVHRGTISPSLDCVGAGSPQCREELVEIWGDGLRHFNTLQAARDLGALIERAGLDETGRVIVYGISYGTLWGQYYLAIHPEQSDGVILDSVLTMRGAVLEQERRQQEQVEALLQRCVDDPVCGERVGFTSGAEFAAAVVQAFESGECGTIDTSDWPAAGLRPQLGFLMNQARSRSFVPLLAALLQRCSPDLTEVAAQAMPQLNGPDLSRRARSRQPIDTWEVLPKHYFGDALGELVMATTVLPDGGDPVEASDASLTNLATLGFGDTFLLNYDVWGDLPNHAIPPVPAAFAPTLILNASFDMQTPLAWAEEVAAELGEPLYAFDDAAHGIVFEGSAAPDSVSCGQSLMLDFAIDGTRPADSPCSEEVVGVDVNLGSEPLRAMAQTAFGTPDPWTLLD